jgi:S-adenosylmethionine synthetase
MAPHTVLFTSESVTEGHPDKVADQISDAILDAHLAQDPNARVACETLVAPGLIVLAGEVTSFASVDVETIARAVVRDIGYDDPALGFAAGEVEVIDRIGAQSKEIGAGVDRSRESRAGEIADAGLLAGAGDQGMMFGYATRETPELMPLPIALAHRLARQLARVRHDGSLPGLRPDGKTQVTIRYRDGVAVGVERVLISTQHEPGVTREFLEAALLEQVVLPVVPGALGDRAALTAVLLVNPAGSFVLGGPAADCGLTGRKIIVDSYGGMARHGGGAFSGKDPSKVDRSAAYAARHVAKNVVAAGLADRCELQVAYAIGSARPVSVMVETFGTGRLADERLAVIVDELFDLRPGALRKQLDLHRPIYRPTATYGHFGRDDLDLPWEHINRVDDLRDATR